MMTKLPWPLVFSPSMQQRIASGEADKAVVTNNTRHLFELLEELNNVFRHTNDQAQVRKANQIGKCFEESLTQYGDTVDWDAKMGSDTLLDRCVWIQSWDESDELDGVIYRDETERRKDQRIKKRDFYTNPSLWFQEQYLPWGKRLMAALIDAGASVHISGSNESSLLQNCIDFMHHGQARVLLDRGVRLREDGSFPENLLASKRSNIANDDQLNEIRDKKFTDFVSGYYQRAQALQTKLDDGSLVPDQLTSQDICLLSLIQRHHEAFDRQKWYGKETEAFALVQSLSPFLQRELGSEVAALMAPATEIFAPTTAKTISPVLVQKR